MDKNDLFSHNYIKSISIKKKIQVHKLRQNSHKKEEKKKGKRIKSLLKFHISNYISHNIIRICINILSLVITICTNKHDQASHESKRGRSIMWGVGEREREEELARRGAAARPKRISSLEIEPGPKGNRKGVVCTETK